MGQHLLIIVFWGLFGLTHSLLAAPGAKQWAQRIMGRQYRWYRPLYSVLSFVQTALILAFLFSMESVELWQLARGAQAFFVLTAIVGLVMMGISIRKYFFQLSGIQVIYKKQQDAVLEQQGLHEYVRHPLYSGTLLFAWSLFFLFPYLSFLLTCACMTIYTLIGIRLEEKKLEDLFGQQYKSYKNNVPMIIPFTKFGRLSKSVSENPS